MLFCFCFWDCVKAKKRVFVTIPDRGNQFLHWLVTAWVQNQPLCSNLDLTVLSFLPLSKVLNSIWLIGSHQLEKFNSLMTARPLDQFMDPSTHCIYCLTQTVTFQVGWQSTFEDEVGAWEAENGALGSAPAPGYGRGAGGDHHHHHHHHHHQNHIDLISLYVIILWMRWRWKRQRKVWTATNTPTTTTRTTTRTIITNRSTTSNTKLSKLSFAEWGGLWECVPPITQLPVRRAGLPGPHLCLQLADQGALGQVWLQQAKLCRDQPPLCLRLHLSVPCSPMLYKQVVSFKDGLPSQTKFC